MDIVSAMEPLLPEEADHALEDLAAELLSGASALAARLHPVVRESVGDLVRSMNCYYSNLIEGHDTHPRDIDRALAGEYATDARKRALQLEARAHIDLQRLIDRGALPHPLVSAEGIRWLHREFCQKLPDELLWVENPDTGQRLPVVPGEYRHDYVQVGRHVPPAAEAIPAFLARFVAAYQPRHLSRFRQIVAVAASHHRLLWIHPFFDGNGRVARLFSHAFLKEIGVGASLWSVSRGLARQGAEYKTMLMAADAPRQGDLDGRGNLSARGLKDFCRFFLRCCVDQVQFMDSLLDPLGLSQRMERFVTGEVDVCRLPKGSWPLLREALLSGPFERGRAATLTGYQERQARTVLAQLLAKGLLVSDSPKGAVRLGFPIAVVESWFPRLYPAVG